QDYVYRDGTMLASRVRFDDGSIGVRDYVVDHLGTPRLIGDRFDGLRTQHFFGFGEPIDLAALSSEPERKRFTGHERDLGTLGGAGGVQVELDYMRARFCSPWTARFLSVDPARESANLRRPQTWNRYSYGFNNPVTLVDPDGRAAETVLTQAASAADLFAKARIVASATPPGLLVTGAALAGYAAGRAVGDIQVGSRTVDQRVTDAFISLMESETASEGSLSSEESGRDAFVDHDRNPAQDKKLSKGQIDKLKKAGIDIEGEKSEGPSSKMDLFADKHGNLYIKPKSGAGPGEPLNLNINSLPRSKE
ncbi:MAG: polymorphic toxin type 33 domain-containing protein, partial [Acidobacteriota bacterium]